MADSDSSDGNNAIFETGFAVIIAFVIAILALAVYLAVFKDWWPLGKAGFSDTEWNAFEPRLRVAVKLVAPSALIGAVLIAVGLWMAIVEWRGRFAVAKKLEAGKPGGTMIMSADDAGKAIEALSKLQGAALVMVIGGLLMLSAAWVAQSAASPPPASPASATASQGT